MTRKSILLLGALTLCACTKSSPGDQSNITSSLDSLFSARYGNDPAAPGAAVIIADSDSIIYERYFGTADIPSRRLVDSTTLLNIASVSKQFTVAALLRQNIDMNRTCSDFFPEYTKSFWKEVTLTHLASHSSGIPDSRDRSNRDACVFADEETSVQYFPLVSELKFAPGTAYDYLNPSFILLAKVAEREAGVDFYQYVEDSIFRPLGMNRTIYFSPDTMPATAAHGYVPAKDGGWEEYDYGEETFFATRPDGGIYSTARDMLKWEIGLANGKVMADSLLQLAYSPLVDVASSPWCDYQRRPHTAYGLGWFVESKPGAPVKVYHTGDNGGFQAYVAKYPSTGIKIIVLENRNDRPRRQMAEAIDSILTRPEI